MSDVYLIEVAGRAAGLVVRDETGKAYRFHAAVPLAYGLDGRLFRTPGEAQKAVSDALGRNARPEANDLDHAA
jgi:hypothetical protein